MEAAPKPFLTEFFGLEEPEPDSYCGLVCPPSQSKVLLYASYFTLISVAIGIYNGYYDLALVAFAGWITSILYWSNPTYSWRRILDIVVVQIALWWHIYRAIGAENSLPYFIIVGTGSLTFVAGWILFKTGATWAGTLAHVVVHICANMSMIVLYIGSVPPLTFFPFISL